MSEKIKLTPIERLRYLLVYRSWFGYIVGILFFIAAIGVVFVIVEIASTGLIQFSPIIVIMLYVIGALIAIALIWNFHTEWNIVKARRELFAELKANAQAGQITAEKETEQE